MRQNIFTQGSSFLATAGLYDATPLGLENGDATSVLLRDVTE